MLLWKLVRLVKFCFFSMVFPSLALAENCLNSEQLTELKVTQVVKIQPCNLLGRAYLWGLDHGNFATGDFDATDLEGYQFYLPMRLYLSREQKNIVKDFNGEFAFLLSSTTYLWQASVERAAAYQVFVLSKYWTQHSSHETAAGFWMQNAIQESVLKTGLSSLREIECFVQSDIPDLAFQKILVSQNYRNCTEED